MSKKLTGADLIEMGYTPSKKFGEMIALANTVYGSQDDIPEVLEILDTFMEQNKPAPTIPLQHGIKYDIYLDESDDPYEASNRAKVLEHMNELVKTPTVVSGAVMPDACPAGSALGTIPVGGVIGARNAIHPGMHSADICCSMFLTSMNIEVPVTDVLDAVQRVSHFGPGGRFDTFKMDVASDLYGRAQCNSFLGNIPTLKAMSEHLGTQGDGNHFFYVGRARSTDELTLVTHHGSRKPGALLYKAGMKVAERYRMEISPDTTKHNAWIPFDTEDGQSYWEALQIIREWTKLNHTLLHNGVISAIGGLPGNITDRFWNEHNFVFKRGDVFHHAKGSTPVFENFAEDADVQGRSIIPLNMSQPILIVKRHESNYDGFAPHGAGRNMSRTQFMKLNAGKTVEQLMTEQTSGIDARFWSGEADASELPGAYKNADEVVAQMLNYKLANITDYIDPLGSMMGGVFYQEWRNKKKK